MKKNNLINTAIYSLMLLLFISCSQDPNTEIIYRNTFTVTFHANGGNGEMDDQTFVQNEQQALSKNAFTASQSGRTFGGWAIKATGEKVYSDAQFITINKNMNLYAVWTMAEGDGSATESKVWGIDDTNNFWNYMDKNIKPGDDFYKYSIGGWQADPVAVGLWNKVEGRENRTDDKGSPLENLTPICRDAILNALADTQKEIFSKTNQLYPSTETDMLNGLAVFLNNRFAEIDSLSTQDDILRYFAKAMIVYHPLFSFFIDESGRQPRLSITISPRYLPLMLLLSNNTDTSLYTIQNFFATYTQYDSESIIERNNAKRQICKQLLSISPYEDTTDDIDFRASLYSFILPFARESAVEPTNPDAFIDAVKDVLNIGDDIIIDCINDKYLQLLSAIGDPAYSDDQSYQLSIDNAKHFLKFAYTSAGYDIFFNKIVNYYADDNGNISIENEEIRCSEPYRYPLMESFYNQYIKDNPANKDKKTYIKDMCEGIRSTFIKRLQNNTWMSNSTKEAAIKKAEEIIFFVGYPDSFNSQLSFDTLPVNISSQTSWGNFYKLLSAEALKRYVSFFNNSNNKDTDKIINARIYNDNQVDLSSSYMQTNNTVNILITYLVDPICNTDYTDAYNYGILGHVIAHELCHAFDAIGSEYDENGNKRDWWALSDKLRYKQKQSQLIELYNMLELDSGTSGNGQMTLTENMADLGGLTTIYDLFVSKKIEEGYAGEELIKQKKMFFQSYAILWASNQTDSYYEENMNDVHSPNPFRVNGIVCQFDDWYDVYNIQKGNKYYLDPSQRIVLW